MRITVKLFATFRRYRPELPPGTGMPLEVPPGANVTLVMERLGIPDEMPLVAMVNSEVVHPDRVLAEGDTVSLFPPIAGG